MSIIDRIKSRFIASSAPTDGLRLTGEAVIDVQAAGKGKPARVTISAYDGNVMRVPGFGPVVVDLAGMQLPESITLLADHDASVPGIVGVATPAVERGALTATGTLSQATEAGRTIVALHRDGVRFEASIGGEPLDRRYIRERESVKVNGRAITATAGGFQLITKSILKEISLLPIGASANTSVAIAATAATGLQGDTAMTFDQWLTANGWKREDLSASQVKKLEAAYNAEHGLSATAGGGDGDPVAAERVRQASIIRICAGRHPHLEAQAIALGWDKTRTELEVMRASRSQGPAGFGHSGNSGQPDQAAVLEASLCLNAGLSEKFVGAQYSEAVMNAATSAKHRSVGLQSVLRLVLATAGLHDLLTARVDNSVIRSAFEADRMLRASAGGFSTISLPGILSNVASKAMLASYQAVASTWSEFCRVASNADFKAAKRYRLTGEGRFETVGPDGELKHVSLVEEDYDSQLLTHGAIIALTRQMIINDDMGAFLQLPTILGRMSGIKIEREVYSLWLSNPDDFFSAGNGNYFSGASTTLGLDSLATAEQKFVDQTDENGDPILISAARLLVPTTLKTVAATIINSLEIARDTSSTDNLPTGNPWRDTLKPVVSPWLNAQSLDGSSTTAWYLTADPASGIAPMEVAFLNGQQAPIIESADTSFDTLGMQMRGYFDFGVAMQDPRAAVMSKGAA